MGRTAKQAQKQLSKIIVSVIVVAGLVGGGVGAWYQLHNPARVQVTTNDQQQTTQISYRGQQGVDALTLLKRHAQVQTKHYSFGDFVVSINGTAGNGPKYWTLFVNNKESSAGASAYITKSTDTVTWKLQ